MTTLEPLSEAELNELQARWMEGNQERRTYRARPDNSVDSSHSSFGTCSHKTPLSEDCRRCAAESEVLVRGPEQPPFPARWFEDVEEHANYLRHTVDINTNPMSVEDEPIAYVKPWKWLVWLGVVVVFWGLVAWAVHR